MRIKNNILKFNIFKTIHTHKSNNYTRGIIIKISKFSENEKWKQI